jgi:hypothetical protein
MAIGLTPLGVSRPQPVVVSPERDYVLDLRLKSSRIEAWESAFGGELSLGHTEKPVAFLESVSPNVSLLVLSSLLSQLLSFDSLGVITR